MESQVKKERMRIEGKCFISGDQLLSLFSVPKNSLNQLVLTTAEGLAL